MDDTRILLAHGNGGRLMRELITDIFSRHLGNPLLDTDADAVTLPHVDGDIMVTTDGFTVEPLEFPGGDIGSLAVHGVVNDLAVAGADPLYFTVSALIEEGLEVAVLDRYITSFARAARQNHVAVVAGDTKVVRRGEGSGLYLSVAGIGVRRAATRFAMDRIAPGDVVLVSGPVGDHGIAVMLARAISWATVASPPRVGSRMNLRSGKSRTARVSGSTEAESERSSPDRPNCSRASITAMP